MRDTALHTEQVPCPGGCGDTFPPSAIIVRGLYCWHCEAYVYDLAHPTQPAPTAAPPDTRSEKRIQRAIRVTLATANDVHVWDLSQPRAAMQTPGIPDLYVVREGRGGLWVEVKRPGGELSVPQEFFRDTCQASGIPWACWRSEEDALRWLEETR